MRHPQKHSLSPKIMENRLQKFKLPEPILCIGGIVQVELLGRCRNKKWTVYTTYVYWSYHFFAHTSNASYQPRLQMGRVSIIENMLTDGWSEHRRSNSCGTARGHGML
ncbi:hypothetical protein RHGRI_022150 [Rhododendron griersonianum]|uniref:Uncharacterized protein n=1 Tax=Rhododendron griersonianum TaxID=479676 RepID=A0AAV6JP78_9ERIC|nr:hypothetical protein RHGRI_022150 [Rhododendron griersonianum]